MLLLPIILWLITLHQAPHLFKHCSTKLEGEGGVCEWTDFRAVTASAQLLQKEWAMLGRHHIYQGKGKWILIALYTQEQGAKARHEQHKSLFVPRGNLTRIKIDVLPLEAAPYISLILLPNRSKLRVVLNSWLCIKSCCKVQINANWIRRLHCPVR